MSLIHRQQNSFTILFCLPLEEKTMAKMKTKKSYNKGWRECKVKWYEKKVSDNLWIAIFSAILLIQFIAFVW